MKIWIIMFFFIFSTVRLFGGDEDTDYQTYSHQSLQFELKYPGKMLFPEKEDGQDAGRTFHSSDKKVSMKVWSKILESGVTWDKEFQNILDSLNSTKVTYKVLGKNFFVISGYQGDRIIYYKETFIPGDQNQNILVFEMIFPKNDKDTWNPILISCVDSLKTTQSNSEIETASNSGDSVVPDYEKNYSGLTENILSYFGFKSVESLTFDFAEPVTARPVTSLVLPLGANDESVTLKTSDCQGCSTLISSQTDPENQTRSYQTAFFSSNKKCALILNCLYTPEQDYQIGPIPATTTCEMSLYVDGQKKWTFDNILHGDDDGSLSFEDAFLGDYGFVYLKTNTGFVIVGPLGNIILNKPGDSHISGDKKYIVYNDNSFISWFDILHLSNHSIPPNDCSVAHGVSNFGSFFLGSISKTENNDSKTIYEMLDGNGAVKWHINTAMKPIDFVYPEREGYDGGFIVFFDEVLKKFVFFRTQEGILALTVSLPSLGKGFEDYWANPILSYDGNLLAVAAESKTLKNHPSKLFVFNIKGEILWSMDQPAGRCFFTSDNKLIISGETDKTFSYVEKF